MYTQTVSSDRAIDTIFIVENAIHIRAEERVINTRYELNGKARYENMRLVEVSYRL